MSIAGRLTRGKKNIAELQKVLAEAHSKLADVKERVKESDTKTYRVEDVSRDVRDQRADSNATCQKLEMKLEMHCRALPATKKGFVLHLGFGEREVWG